MSSQASSHWQEEEEEETIFLAKCACTHKEFVSGLQVLSVLTLSVTHNRVQYIIKKYIKVEKVGKNENNIKNNKDQYDQYTVMHIHQVY